MIKFMLWFLLLFFLALIPMIYLFRKYKNPYKLIMVFGKKGSGKTTLLAKLAYQAIMEGKTVYSTVYVPGAWLFNVEDIGKKVFEPDSVIFIDEVGMIWDNRQFKNFRTDVRDYFKLQRHYKNTVYLFSQTFDIDIKLRNLTDSMYLCRCYMGWFSVAKKIRRDIVLTEPIGESEARIADSLEFEPWWLSIFGARTRIFTYIPKWSKLYNSFEVEQMPLIESEYCQVPKQLHKFYKIVTGVDYSEVEE